MYFLFPIYFPIYNLVRLNIHSEMYYLNVKSEIYHISFICYIWNIFNCSFESVNYIASYFSIFIFFQSSSLWKIGKQILLQVRFLHILKLRSGIHHSFLSPGSNDTIVDVHYFFICFHCSIASWYVGGLKDKHI